MNVIRIPTKFARSIKRLSDKERLSVFDSLLKIGEDEVIQLPDSASWDLVQLIYWEWMNMESRNWWKPSINHISESLGTNSPSDSEPRVEYSRVEENRIEYKSISKDIENSIELSEPKVEFWNKEINGALDFLKKAIGIDDFKESKPIQRQFWNHIVKLRDKIWNEDLKNRIVGIVSDWFKRKNCNSIQYLYRELKSYVKEDAGFIPKAPKIDASGRNLDRMEQLAQINIT